MLRSVKRSIKRPIARHPRLPYLHPNLIACFPLGWNLRDYITGAYMSLTRSGSLTYLGKDDLYHTASADNPGIGKYGLFHDGAGTNVLLNNRDLSAGDWNDQLSSKSQNETGIDGVANKAWTITDSDDVGWAKRVWQTISIPDDSATHTITFYIGKEDDESSVPQVDYVLYDGTSITESVQINKKTGASYENNNDGTYSVRNVGSFWELVLTLTNNGTGNTTLYYRIYPAYADSIGASTSDKTTTGSCVYDFGQVELNKSYASSPIETGASAVSRATQAADASDNGLSIALSSIPGLEEALGSGGSGEGTMICEIRCEFPEDLGDFTDAGLVTSQDGVTSVLYATTNDTLVAGDGTNTVTDANAWDRNEASKLAVRWSGSTLELLRKKADESSWTTSSGTFDGGFPLGTDLRLFYDNEYPQWLRNLRFYDVALSDGEIAREAS